MARPRPLRDLLNHPAPATNHTRKRVSARKRPRPETPTPAPAPPPRRSLRVQQRPPAPAASSAPRSPTTNSNLSASTDPNPLPARPAKRPKPAPAAASAPAAHAQDDVLRHVLAQPASVRAPPPTKNLAAREVLVDWLMEVAVEFSARDVTLALSVSYLDRVWSQLSVPQDDLQLLAVTCMWVACKVEETEPPRVADTVFICDHLYHKEQVLAMEKTVLNRLGFRLTLPTHLAVVGMVARRVGETVEEVVRFAAHLAMMDGRACRHGVGVVALGCVLASCWVADVGEKEMERAVGSDVWGRWGAEAREVARRLFKVWKGVKGRHERDESRWMLIRWAGLHERFRGCDRKRRAANFEKARGMEMGGSNKLVKLLPR